MPKGQWLLVAFAAMAILEMYFFLWQRVPLEVGREHGIPTQLSNFMLPSWFWLVRLVQWSTWALAVVIGFEVGWWQALVCLAIPFVLSTRIPVPYTHFSGRIERRLRSELRGPHSEIASSLLEALTESRRKHGF
jgi:hypothetical protein